MPLTVAQIKQMLATCDEKEYEAFERSLAADTRKGVISALASTRKRLEAEQVEKERVDGLYAFEESMARDDALIVGLDEVGRGSVAGPLAVGAVVLDRGLRIAGLNDSKKIPPEKRERVADEVKRCSLFWTVSYVQPVDIDRFGMTQSLRMAFSNALAAADEAVGSIGTVLIDGNPLRIDPREINIIKGDAKCASISAASIVAKVERDALMERISADYPQYALDVNKGYASPQHIDAIRHYGLSEIHRSTFCRSFLQETLF